MNEKWEKKKGCMEKEKNKKNWKKKLYMKKGKS